MKVPLTLSGLLATTILIAQQNVISILNDRFSFTFPDSAKNIARATNIMAADPNANNETRVMYDIGEKRIVFFSQELYIKAGEKLENKLKEESTAAYPFIVKTIYEKDSVQCISMTPQKFDDKKNAIVTNSLLIKNADNTLSKLTVYLNPKAFADRKIFDKITEEVFKSFKKGTRRLSLDNRTENFNVLSSKTVMQLKLPKDYIVTIDKKYDFEVYKIKKVIAYGDTTQADLTVYFGFYPSLFNNEYELDKYKKADTDGQFMLQNIKWLNFQDDNRNLVLREQLFEDDDIQKNAKVHVAMISNNQQAIDELTSIVKDILFKYGK